MELILILVFAIPIVALCLLFVVLADIMSHQEETLDIPAVSSAKLRVDLKEANRTDEHLRKLREQGMRVRYSRTAPRWR